MLKIFQTLVMTTKLLSSWEQYLSMAETRFSQMIQPTAQTVLNQMSATL